MLKGKSWKRDMMFNHAFDVAFSVPNSQYEDWEDCLRCEKQQVIDALQSRIRELFEAKEYLEAISGFDSYEEGDLTNVDPEVLKGMRAEQEEISREELRGKPVTKVADHDLEDMERICGVHKSQPKSQKQSQIDKN